MEFLEDCLFCQLVADKAPAKKVWENKEFVAIENKYPKAPVHILVMPKEHLSKKELARGENSELWRGLMQAVFEVVRMQKLDQTGYKLVNNGAGYNHFDHEHMHVMGGSKTEPGGES